MSDLRKSFQHVPISPVLTMAMKVLATHGAHTVTSAPGVHKLTWFPSTTLLAEGGPPLVMGGRLRAATVAAMFAAAACDPAGSVLFEY